MNNQEGFFDYLIVVRLPRLGKDQATPTPLVEYRFPPHDHDGRQSVVGGATDKFLDSITEFCFPDRATFGKIPPEGEWFSFVLTSDDGARRFGYCFRTMPPPSAPKTPACFCLLSYSPCFTVFTHILRRVAAKYDFLRDNGPALTLFLQPLYRVQLPEPGESIRIPIPASPASPAALSPSSPATPSDAHPPDPSSGQEQLWLLTRPNGNDTPLEYINFQPLLQKISESTILRLFVAMLAERRVIFVSSSLSVLSQCAQAAAALLYPFHWQHVFIPVLPSSLLYFCCAPMPFVVGLLASFLPALEELSDAMEDVFILDLDSDRFLRKSVDDTPLIPKDLLANLKSCLKSLQKRVLFIRRRNLGPSSSAGELPPLEKRNRLLEAFLAFFVEILSGYRRYIDPHHEDGFDKASFVEEASPSIREFLRILTGTQMFERFIAERVRKQLSQQSLFDRRVTLYNNIASLTPGGDAEPSRFSRFEKNLAMGQILHALPQTSKHSPFASSAPTNINSPASPTHIASPSSPPFSTSPPFSSSPSSPPQSHLSSSSSSSSARSQPLSVLKLPSSAPTGLSRPLSREKRSETTSSVPERFPGPLKTGSQTTRARNTPPRPNAADPRLFYPSSDEKPRPSTLFELDLHVSLSSEAPPSVVLGRVAPQHGTAFVSSSVVPAAEPIDPLKRSPDLRRHNVIVFNQLTSSPNRAAISPAARMAESQQQSRSTTATTTPTTITPNTTTTTTTTTASLNHNSPSPSLSSPLRSFPDSPTATSSSSSSSSAGRSPLNSPLHRNQADPPSCASPALPPRGGAEHPLSRASTKPQCSSTSNATQSPTPDGAHTLDALLLWLRRNGQSDFIPRIEALSPSMETLCHMASNPNLQPLYSMLELPSTPKTLKLVQSMKEFFSHSAGSTGKERHAPSPRATPSATFSHAPSPAPLMSSLSSTSLRPLPLQPSRAPTAPHDRPHRLPSQASQSSLQSSSSPLSFEITTPRASIQAASNKSNAKEPRPLPPIPTLSNLPQKKVVGMNIAAFERAIRSGSSIRTS